jgi:hypothetical protein
MSIFPFLSSKIFCLNLPCYHPLAVFLPRLGFTSMLLLNRVRKYALVANFRIRTCWPASVAFQVVLILPEALKPCGNFRGC